MSRKNVRFRCELDRFGHHNSEIRRDSDIFDIRFLVVYGVYHGVFAPELSMVFCATVVYWQQVCYGVLHHSKLTASLTVGLSLPNTVLPHRTGGGGLDIGEGMSRGLGYGGFSGFGAWLRTQKCIT